MIVPFSYHQKYLLQRYPRILTQLDIEPGEDLITSFVATRLNGYLGGYGTLKKFDEEKEKLGLPPKVEEYVRKQIQDKTGNDVEC
jgi:peptide-methionine (S)-S-oxide reductase